MSVPIKVVDFLKKNKNKHKKEVIKEMMEKFNYKERSALSYYSNYSSNLKNKKEIIFSFFKENPDALNDTVNKKYVNKLGVTKSMYRKYKSQYKVLHPIEIKKEVLEWDKHYKGRPRNKFIFDDSKLFG